jgi:hypothetical protein
MKEDNILTVASGFDWITPAVAFLQDMVYGPAADFGISAAAGWGRGDVRRLLDDNGIKVWGVMLNISGDLLMFTVPQAQAGEVSRLLQRAGVPVLHAPALELEAF